MPAGMAPAVASDRFTAGARIGDYRVDYEVAIEATAVVYLATHVVLPRKAHIKVSHPGSRSSAIQLLREACLLEVLSHAGIPRVHECGVLADRRPWCAIEIIAGATFKQLTGAGPVALSELVVALRDIADILQHAHERGIVHRRLIASSIVQTQRRRNGYAISDWSDARTLDAAADTVVDPRNDVHALGGIAFRALTGKLPEPLVSAATYCPAAPAELVSLIDQMLGEPGVRPAASDVYERALGLCNTLEAPPRPERARWTPPQGYVPDGVSAGSLDEHRGGFAIRIARVRTS
jgi:serine/threonine protein kinase